MYEEGSFRAGESIMVRFPLSPDSSFLEGAWWPRTLLSVHCDCGEFGRGGGIVCGDGRLFGIVGQPNAEVVPQGEELAQCQKRFWCT